MITLVAIASIIGAPVGILSVLLLVRQSIRESRTQRESPLRERLAEVTKDRDYFRDRADAFETELRNREN